ncbi:MAG: hypothetical protein ACJ8GJ_00175 [Vitreoscilla sp.]
MNAVTEESLDWNAAAAAATGERRAKTLRNSLSAAPSVFEIGPHLPDEAAQGGRATPPQAGARVMCQNLFTDPGTRFPDEFPVTGAPKEHA